MARKQNTQGVAIPSNQVGNFHQEMNMNKEEMNYNVAIPSNQVGNFHHNILLENREAFVSQSLQIRSVISILRRAILERTIMHVTSQSLQIRSVISIAFLAKAREARESRNPFKSGR